MPYEPKKIMAECKRIIGPTEPGAIGRERPWKDAAVRAMTFCALKELTYEYSDHILADMVGLTRSRVRIESLYRQHGITRRGAEAFVKWVRWNLDHPQDRITNRRVLALAKRVKRGRKMTDDLDFAAFMSDT